MRISTISSALSNIHKRWQPSISSSKKNIFGIHPLVVSTAYIGLSIGICYLIRRTVKNWISDNVFRDILLEFITTLEMCISFFELIVGENSLLFPPKISQIWQHRFSWTHLILVSLATLLFLFLRQSPKFDNIAFPIFQEFL